MVYNQLPNNTMWMSVAHLNDFINTSFAVDLSVVANRQSMLRAINRMRSVAPFTRNSRFPPRALHISLEGEWYSVFMRLTQLLSQRDRAANITSSQTDNIRTDNNMRALFAAVEEINELRTRRYGFLNREAFEDIYPWEDTETTARATPQIELLQRQIADLATSMRMTQTPVSQSPVVTKYNDEDIRIMSAWARPYPYSAVKERCVMIKRSIIDDVMNNPTASRILPTDDEIRVMAINALDKEHQTSPNKASAERFMSNIPSTAEHAVASRVEPKAKPQEEMTFGDYVDQILDEGLYDTDEKQHVVQILKNTMDTVMEAKTKAKSAVSFADPVTTSTVENTLVMPQFGAITSKKTSADLSTTGVATPVITAGMLFGHDHNVTKPAKDPDDVGDEDLYDHGAAKATYIEDDRDPMGTVAKHEPPLVDTAIAVAPIPSKKKPTVLGAAKKK